MKGATPSGPIVFVSIEREREHDRLADDRQAAEAVHHRVREPRRKVLRADPDRDREQHAAGDERRRLRPSR